MSAPRRDLSHYPISLRHLSVDGQMQIRVSLAHSEHMFPGPLHADGVSSPTIDLDVVRRDELANTINIAGADDLFNVTTDHEFILVCCHASMVTPNIESIYPKGRLARHLVAEIRLVILFVENPTSTGFKRFIFFHQKRHPREMGAGGIQAFLTHLAAQQNVAALDARIKPSNAPVFLYPQGKPTIAKGP